MAQRMFTANARKEGAWWMIEVDGLDHITQARKLGEIDEMATSLVASVLDLSPDDVEVTVTVHPPATLETRWEKARADLENGAELVERGGAEQRAIIAALRGDNFTLKEVARMLGISFQRVQQLAGPKAKGGTA